MSRLWLDKVVILWMPGQPLQTAIFSSWREWGGGYFLKHNSSPSPNTYMFKHCLVDWLLCFLFSEESALSSGFKAQIVLLLNQTWVLSLVCSEINLLTLGCMKESTVFISGHAKQPNSLNSTKNLSKAFLKSRWGRGVPGYVISSCMYPDRLMVLTGCHHST